jgi:hypothetical protein
MYIYIYISYIMYLCMYIYVCMHVCMYVCSASPVATQTLKLRPWGRGPWFFNVSFFIAKLSKIAKTSYTQTITDTHEHTHTHTNEHAYCLDGPVEIITSHTWQGPRWYAISRLGRFTRCVRVCTAHTNGCGYSLRLCETFALSWTMQARIHSECYIFEWRRTCLLNNPSHTKGRDRQTDKAPSCHLCKAFRLGFVPVSSRVLPT